MSLELISQDSVYAIVWSTQFKDRPCVLKIVVLETGVHQQNGEYYKGKKKITSHAAKKYFDPADEPWNPSRFFKKKSLTVKKFEQEVSNLKTLAQIGLSPTIHAFGIMDKYDVHYGYIIMDKLDTSVKNLLLTRTLTTQEETLIHQSIDRLHQAGYIHNDLKPSNIGVYLLEGNISSCLFLDCQKVQGYSNSTSPAFRHLVKHDLDHYQRHVKRNLKAVTT